MFLHPVNSESKLQTKHFQIIQEVNSPKERIRVIESQHPAVNGNYKHGVMIEPEGKNAYVIYGSYIDIQNLGKELFKNSEKTQKDFKIGTESDQYYLNHVAPPNLQNELTPKQSEDAARAYKSYPEQGDSNRPLSKAQELKVEMKDHLEQELRRGIMYPDTPEGQKQIQARREKAFPKKVGTLLDPVNPESVDLDEPLAPPEVPNAA